MTAQPKIAEFDLPMAGQKTINLALQGGGSHGAFTWGVLDRLLEEDQLIIDGITATSAGSINAVVLAHGLSAGGREGAKKALTLFWQRLSTMAASSVFSTFHFRQSDGKFRSRLFGWLPIRKPALSIPLSLSTQPFQF